MVYNHTAEGNALGPTLSFRGIDNASYYKLADDCRHYYDTTGCGNTLNIGHPRVLQLVMDSLRYWVEQGGVDGFRFDLASSLARDGKDFNPSSSFLDAIGQDPVLSRVKLIAEPWDLGENGYQVGAFPPGWAEWNDQWRDGLRSYWKGDMGQLPALGRRIAGSAEVYDRRGRRPWASVNFVTAHDGFTLRDLVSYNEKHNEANKEENKDGHDESAASKAQPTIRPFSTYAIGSAALSLRACCSAKARPCCKWAMSWAGLRAATTMPFARTTRFPGCAGTILANATPPSSNSSAE
jgi:glycogen operon protein